MPKVFIPPTGGPHPCTQGKVRESRSRREDSGWLISQPAPPEADALEAEPELVSSEAAGDGAPRPGRREAMRADESPSQDSCTEGVQWLRNPSFKRKKVDSKAIQETEKKNGKKKKVKQKNLS